MVTDKEACGQPPYMPIPKQFWELVPEASRFVVSFPRSGSRWIRLLLTDLVHSYSGLDAGELYEAQLANETKTSGFSVGPEILGSFCADVYRVAFEKRVSPTAGLAPEIPRVWRSHNLDGLRAVPSRRIIYPLRDPLPLLNSYIPFARKTGHLGTEPSELQDFCISRINEWILHVETALSMREEDPNHFLLIRYGDRLPFSESQLGLMARLLEIPVSESQICDALVRFRRFVHRLNEEKNVSDLRARNPGEGQWNPDLSEEIIGKIRESSGPMWARALAAADSQ